jgi:hypothetical protein
MSNRFISIDSFLEPWLVQVKALDAALGRKDEVVLEGTKLHEAATAVFDAAFTMPAESVGGKGLLEKADWLLQMLSTNKERYDYSAIARIPFSFWETLAGRAIVRVMELEAGKDFVVAKEAALKLNISEVRLYHLAATRRIPFVLDFRENNPRRRRRFRVDQLREIPLLDDEEDRD